MNIVSALNLQAIIVLSKAELANDLSQLYGQVESACKRLHLVSKLIKYEQDLQHCLQAYPLVPAIPVSSTSGLNLWLFRQLLWKLPKDSTDLAKEAQEFLVDWSAKQKEFWILGGPITKGVIALNDQMLMGPNDDGLFTEVLIIGIHVKQTPQTSVQAGQMASFKVALPEQDNYFTNSIRKGTVLLDNKLHIRGLTEFTAEIQALDDMEHVVLAQHNYEPLIVSRTIRQCACLLE